ncbi:MAG TPA: hypothetical protein PL044_11955 [Clostridiales bacterium]|nr:hypothetical protein [Clostridiales bacterium]HQH64469.1 hypothetical protein [Clostridiales bacterium]HQK74473.1 hypothetical protein [Clostridiales bacterium]
MDFEYRLEEDTYILPAGSVVDVYGIAAGPGSSASLVFYHSDAGRFEKAEIYLFKPA